MDYTEVYQATLTDIIINLYDHTLHVYLLSYKVTATVGTIQMTQLQS